MHLAFHYTKDSLIYTINLLEKDRDFYRTPKGKEILEETIHNYKLGLELLEKNGY